MHPLFRISALSSKRSRNSLPMLFLLKNDRLLQNLKVSASHSGTYRKPNRCDHQSTEISNHSKADLSVYYRKTGQSISKTENRQRLPDYLATVSVWPYRSRYLPLFQAAFPLHSNNFERQRNSINHEIPLEFP